MKIQITAKVETHITMVVEVDDTNELTLEHSMNDVFNECHYEYTHDSIVETEIGDTEFIGFCVIT